MYKIVFKRVIDIVVAAIVLLVASPFLIFVIVVLAISNKGSVFFFQKRPGLNGDLFKLVKFKTMKDLYDEKGKPLPDKDRITPLGKFVRKTSMDELPQLINVLKGDMSLVGPRPLLERYLPLYNEVQKRRHNVKPGITGWAQVNGRNALSWQEKFSLDVYYVDNISFMLDMKILLLTFVKIFKTSDINASQATTMKPFEGN